MTAIRPTDDSIRTILENIDKGKWVIPNFQRDFTWTTTQVKELIESVLQSYYIGAVLIWKCRDNKSAKLAVEPVYGTKLTQDDLETEAIILDGQQRLTSLYYAKYSPDKRLKWTKYPYAFFICIEKILEEDYDDCVVQDSKQSSWCQKLLTSRKEQFEQKLFPISELENLHYWLDDFQEYLEEEKNISREDSKKIKKKIWEHFEILEKDYRIVIIELPEDMKLDHVCEIFERINSKGTTLTVFDLLNARLLKDGIELRKKLWRSVVNKENGRINEFSKDNSSFPVLILQTVSLIRKGYCKRKDLIELTSTNFIVDWNTSINFVEQALKVITNYRDDTLSFGVINKNYLPYQPMIPILAVLLKLTKDQENVPSCSSKIANWYWSSVFKKTYSGSTDTQIAKDLRQMKLWFEDDSKIPEVVPDAGTTLDLNLVDENRTTGALYRGILSLIVLNGAKDFITGQLPEYNRLNDHHIFPKGQIENIELDKKENINSVLNRTLISEDSNLKGKMKKLPRVYLKEIEKNIGKEQLLKNLESHFINEKCYEHMLNNNFKDFIKERSKLINAEIIKRVSLKTCS
jgi:hypothetical protein